MIKLSWIVLFLALPAIGLAQSITMEDAVVLATTKSPLVQASEREVAYARMYQRTAVNLPKTDISMLYGQYNSIVDYDNNITISQAIPASVLFGKQMALNRALTQYAVASEYRTRHEVAYQVRQVFNRLLYLKTRGKVLQQQVQLLGHLSRIAETQFKVGESALLAVTLAESQRMEVENAKVLNEEDYQASLAQLRLLCQTNEITDVDGTLEMNLTPVFLDNLSQSPLLALPKQQDVVAEHQQKYEQSNLLPDIQVGFFSQTLVGTQVVNGIETFYGDNKRFHGFQVGLSLPIWFAPHVARAKAAAIRVGIIKKQNEAIVLEVSQFYEQTVREYTKHANSLTYYRTYSLSAATKLREQSENAYRKGEVDLTTLLLSMKQALLTEEAYLNTLYNYNQSCITLHYIHGYE